MDEMTKIQAALKWFQMSLFHLANCKDENCEWWWAFNGFLKEQGIPKSHQFPKWMIEAREIQTEDQ